MNPLDSDVKFLKGVGEHRARKLNRLGIHTIGNLLEHFPRAYINRKNVSNIAQIQLGTVSSLVGKICSVDKRRTSNGKEQLNVYLTDGHDQLLCTWFNFQKWLIDKLMIGKNIWVSGLITQYGNHLQILHPEIEILDEDEHQSEAGDFWKNRPLLPIYPLTEGLTTNLLRNLVYNAFFFYHKEIRNHLPDHLLELLSFQHRRVTLQKIHFPKTIEEAEDNRKYFIFEELFYHQLMLLRSRQKRIDKPQGNLFVLKKSYTTKLKNNLKFKLTSAQKRVLQEIVKDMTSPYQMNRLIQGDVGSGKTIVALFAMLIAAENDYQAVLLVPTEILAEQHFNTFTKLLSDQPEIYITLLKGGYNKNKKIIKEELSTGKANIIIGTHALLQKDVVFHKLGIAIIDEQHRFGVIQRGLLSEKNNHPDLISLSATPIPRSLALTLYGDMEISVIDEMPPTRKPVLTVWKSNRHENDVWNYISRELVKGRQAYVVCPLIEESEKIDLLDAETLYKNLKAIFNEHSVALLHGKMKQAVKDEIMRDFTNNAISVLVSTTVIEVGIDVPNASVMVIEHAERFGLSQLHQLRGRVGRGSEESSCYLITYPPLSSEAKERINIMIETNNGFKIAEKDLDLRGPGEFFGTMQSGVPLFKFANIARDQQILQTARRIAESILKNDPDIEKPENAIIKETYNKLYMEKEKLLNY